MDKLVDIVLDEEEAEILDLDDILLRAYERSSNLIPNFDDFRSEASLLRLSDFISALLRDTGDLQLSEIKFLQFIQNILFLKPEILKDICYYREIIKTGNPIDESISRHLLAIKYPWLQGANFSCQNLSGLQLEGADFRMCNFEGADLNKVDFRGAHLLDCNFRGSQLNDADLRGADLDSSDFTAAFMLGVNIDTTTNLHNAIFSKVAFGFGCNNEINGFRRFEPAALTGLNFSLLGGMFCVYADGACFERVNFTDLDLGRGYFRDCIFRECGFDNAEINNADFSGSVFINSVLTSVNFMKTIFTGTHFISVDMAESDISNSKFEGAVFDGVDLSNIEGADASRLMHEAKFNRVMGLDTLYGFDLSRSFDVSSNELLSDDDLPIGDSGTFVSSDEESFLRAHPDNGISGHARGVNEVIRQEDMLGEVFQERSERGGKDYSCASKKNPYSGSIINPEGVNRFCVLPYDHELPGSCIDLRKTISMDEKSTGNLIRTLKDTDFDD